MARKSIEILYSRPATQHAPAAAARLGKNSPGAPKSSVTSSAPVAGALNNAPRQAAAE